MSIADTRLQVHEFLRDTFDQNLSQLSDRLLSLQQLLTELSAGNRDLLPLCIQRAHDLAGSFGVFGLFTPSTAASKIEAMLRQLLSGTVLCNGDMHREIKVIQQTLEP
jgi:chemotaxis protein histidine kinase CheA